MAPPVTPSPHRFVIAKGSSCSSIPGSQFNTTPRFNLSSKSQPISTSHPLRYRTPTCKRLNHQDAIEVESDESSSSEDIGIQDVDIDNESDNSTNDENLKQPVTKRRRKLTLTSFSPRLVKHAIESADEEKPTTDDSDNVLLPSLTPPSHSAISNTPVSSRTPRFFIPCSNPTLNSQNLNEPSFFAKPSMFRPPDLPRQSSFEVDPDPNQFSPHRKGQKYVSGGLAAELRNWLVNIRSSVPETYSNKTNSWLVKVLVESFIGGGRVGMTLVRGKRLQITDDARNTTVEVKVILAGEASSIGPRKGAFIENGSVVGIKGPVWEVSIEGENWGVGVDWQVI